MRLKNWQISKLILPFFTEQKPQQLPDVKNTADFDNNPKSETTKAEVTSETLDDSDNEDPTEAQPEKSKKLYTEKDLNAAIRLANKGISMSKAARKYQIPLSTLRRKKVAEEQKKKLKELSKCRFYFLFFFLPCTYHSLF